MRLTIFFTFFVIQCVFCKTNTKSLTESMGQEVIELTEPLKELPADLDEEPSAEKDDDEKTVGNTLPPATKKEIKKLATIETRRKLTESIQEDDEAKIEKEFAEFYKDNNEYKGESAEVTTKGTTLLQLIADPQDDVPVGRQRDSFKFQPDMNNPREVERFRTSIDEISCDRTQRLDSTVKPIPGGTARFSLNIFFVLSSLLVAWF